MAVTLNGILYTNRTLYHQTFTSPLVSLVDGTTYYAIVKAANKASPQQFATTSSQPVLVLLLPAHQLSDRVGTLYLALQYTQTA